ncbi:MAG TPA: sulfurtransferase complex subunit TusB [Chromatiales bacterium]|nr:sulfurtransferase complex subunit TusB [Thiotrichales bacterium]HIP68470.1 sulfurtransferase complex subunit TusB [Chromatiales bacterium]
MSMLHTINKSPFEKTSFEACLNHVNGDSSILMIEDGVYGAMKGTAFSEKVAATNGVALYILGPDMQARGISEDRLIDGVKVVDYAGFVDLVTEHDKVQAWL